jgi:hypothetical protein
MILFREFLSPFLSIIIISVSLHADIPSRDLFVLRSDRQPSDTANDVRDSFSSRYEALARTIREAAVYDKMAAACLWRQFATRTEAILSPGLKW